MENRYFTDEMLEVLLQPERWRVVSSHFPTEVEAEEAPAHARWMRTHSHLHSHTEVVFTLRGEGYQGFRGRVYPHRPGMVFIFGPSEQHDLGYRPPVPEGEELWLMAVRNRLVARLVSVRQYAMRLPAQWTQLFTWEEVGLTSGAILMGGGSAESASPALVRAEVRSALGMVIGGLVRAGYSALPREDRESFHARVVRMIQQHLDDTAGAGASLDELARIAGYSKYHFVRLFKQHAGQSVHEYIDHCRLERVHTMQQRGFTQKDISAALGFSAPPAFSRWYHRQFGAGSSS